MGAVKILQVVGFKNSGKTAVLCRLLELAKRNGKQVAMIKHHGHGGELATPDSNVDSMRFFNGGADSSLAYGGGIVQFYMRKDTLILDDLISLVQPAKPDLVLIEGFKEAPYEKIVLVRSPEDWLALKQLQNISLVLVHKDVQLPAVDFIGVDKEAHIESWFLHWMEGDENETF